MVKTPPKPGAPAPGSPTVSSAHGGAGGRPDRFATDYGPDNAWSALAHFLARTPWSQRLDPRTQSAFGLRCRNIAVAFEADSLASPGEISSGQIEAWISTQSRNDNVVASYHIVFGRLLRAARLQGQRPADIEGLRRLLRTARPRPERRKREG